MHWCTPFADVDLEIFEGGEQEMGDWGEHFGNFHVYLYYKRL